MKLALSGCIAGLSGLDRLCLWLLGRANQSVSNLARYLEKIVLRQDILNAWRRQNHGVVGFSQAIIGPGLT